MKALLILAFLFISFSAFADAYVIRKQIYLTHEGIFCDTGDGLQLVDCITFVNGQYIAIKHPQVAGNCAQCGSYIGPDSRCENPYCGSSGRHGPKERD